MSTIYVRCLAAVALIAALPAFAAQLNLQQTLRAAEHYSAELSANRNQSNALNAMADSARELPDPKLKFGIENVPVQGGNSHRFTREGMTMQCIGIMQDYISSKKRDRKAETILAQSASSKAKAEVIRVELQRLAKREHVALVPRYADENPDKGGVSARQQQNLGIKTAAVTKKALSYPFTAYASVATDERRSQIVPASANGLVERLYVKAPGQFVKSNEPLAQLWIPEWTAAQQEYLAVRKYGDRSLTATARERLQLQFMPRM